MRSTAILARPGNTLASPDPASDFARVYLRENAPGPQEERWFHAFGCRRWVTVTRDTVENRIVGG